MGPSRKSVSNAIDHTAKANAAERASARAIKSAKGITSSRRTAVRALAMSGPNGDEAGHWDSFFSRLHRPAGIVRTSRHFSHRPLRSNKPKQKNAGGEGLSCPRLN